MEESVKEELKAEAGLNEKSLRSEIMRAFSLPPMEEGAYSPLVLAYLGDGVYEMVIRMLVVSAGNTQVNKLNNRATALVKASAQAALIHAIAEDLDEEEAAVYRRGRNAKSYTVAKHATMSDYRHATGLEALCGYLYLQGKYERLTALLKTGLLRAGLWTDPNGSEKTEPDA